MIGRELAQALAAGAGERSRGHLFVAIDPGAFGDAAASQRRTAAFLSEIKSGRKAAGSDEILIPGERGHRAKVAYLRDGVPLSASIWENTLRIAEDLGVTPPDLPASY
jgi:LDH2 family malate/lactate/ureidoglycolate dehydrogenase